MRLAGLLAVWGVTMVAPVWAQRGTLSSVATVRLVAIKAGTVGVRAAATEASVGLPATMNGLATSVSPTIPVGVSWDVDPAQVGHLQVRYILRSQTPAVPQVVSHEIIATTPHAEGLDHFDPPPAPSVHPLVVRLVVY